MKQESIQNIIVGSATLLFIYLDKGDSLFMCFFIFIFHLYDYAKTKTFFCLDKSKNISYDDIYWYGLIVYFYIFTFFILISFLSKKRVYNISSLFCIKNVTFVFVFLLLLPIFHFDLLYYTMEYSNEKMFYRLTGSALCLFVFLLTQLEKYMYLLTSIMSIGIYTYFITWIFMKCMFHNEPCIGLEDIERVKEMFMTPCL